MNTLFKHRFRDIIGNETSLEEYRDRVLLIVNTASKCGFTPQYQGLEALYEKYRKQGLVVLGFPCNQFRNQEPGDEAQILQFCTTYYDVSFPLFAKVNVNGEEAHPLFVELKQSAPGILGTKAIKWNFTKFLVDRQGHVVKRFAPATPPEKLEPIIETLLSR